MMCPRRDTTSYSSPPVSKDITVTPPEEDDLDVPSERIVEILRAALAFSVIISFFIGLWDLQEPFKRFSY